MALDRINRVRIALHDGSEPLSERKRDSRADRIFQFVPVASGKFHCDAPFRFVVTYGHRFTEAS